MQPHQETSLSVWNKLMDFRISQDAVRQSRLKSFLTVEAYIMLGFAYTLSQAFAYSLVLPQITFFTLASFLCVMGLLLARQTLKAHRRGALTLRQLSHDIQDVERQLGSTTSQEIGIFAGPGGPLPAQTGQFKRHTPIKLTYVRESRRRPASPQRLKPAAGSVVKSPDPLVMRATAIVWAAALIATLAVSYVTMSPTLHLAMEKAAQHANSAS